jgi:hypothetical protein
VVAGIRLRAGRAGSGKRAASMVREAIATARAAGAVGEILVRGDSAYGTGAVVAACLRAGARFSLTLAKNPAVTRAIAAIPEDAWTPVRYPGAVCDPDTGELISDAEVAEVPFTAFASTHHPATARLVVRRVRDRAHGDELFPVWATTRSSPTAPSRPHRRHHPPRARHFRTRLRLDTQRDRRGDTASSSSAVAGYSPLPSPSSSRTVGRYAYMSEGTIARRQVLRGAGIVAGGVAVTGVGLATPAMANENEKGGLTGSWLVTRQDDGDRTQVQAVSASLAVKSSSSTTSIPPAHPSPARGRAGGTGALEPRSGLVSPARLVQVVPACRSVCVW